MDHVAHTLRHQVATGLSSLLLLSAITGVTLAQEHSATGASGQTNPDADTQSVSTTDTTKGHQSCTRDNTVVADVVALEQVYFYNRFGAFNPGGMLYALRRDVVFSSDSESIQIDSLPLSDGNPIPAEHDNDAALAGNVRLRPDKRPRPIVLRVNEGDCLKVVFTNLLSPIRDGEEHVIDPETGREIAIDSDEPATRSASMHVNGLELSGSIESDGTNVGFNPSSLAAPGETRTYTWVGRKEGGYLLYSMAAAAGGEGDGGQLGLGLFGSVNVEPRGSRWYRSQVTGEQLSATSKGTSALGTPELQYEAVDKGGMPILNMLMPSNDPDAAHELVHSDINAVIDVLATDASGSGAENCEYIKDPGSSCGQPFREFTVIFHDEITAVQAFHELEDEDSPMASLRDGMGINYGAAGLGAMVLANRKGLGPAKDCAECKLEEFFLTSWAMGDPALVIERDADNKPVRALYPDDPSNVHHSYLGDAVRFRNLHAGPKETHVFHLHAHQWTQDWQDPNSVYLDSQTISPGSSFTYEVHYGGSGNRNLTPGDSIFHCHLYPHFAQGMWELWRTHDVFEAGTRDRWLPDGEIAGGTPNPAVVPLPKTPLAPMPTSGFRGYPFYIAGIAGHRPPQAPLDIDPAVYTGDTSQTLMRHVVLAGERDIGIKLFGTDASGEKTDLEKKYFDTSIAADDPLGQANRIAARVREQNTDERLFGLAAKLNKAWIRRLPLEGTPEEQTAMEFHAGVGPGAEQIKRSLHGVPEKGYPTCLSDGTCSSPQKPLLFRVNGYSPKPGAPFADPCPQQFYVGKHDDDPDDPQKWASLSPERKYRATYLQFDMPVNKHGWHDPQARIITLEQDAKATMDHTRPAEPFFFRANSGECVVFEATNLIPSNLNLDDFQVFTPTDTIGQHIHLVKFDVTSSDGSGNGWNYEDGTFSPDELRERIIANNTFKGRAELKPLTHRLFQAGGPMAGDERGICPDTLPADAHEAEKLLEAHPWCGAQSTIQRWWADPLLNQDGDDRTIRTVFTHDHFGASSHQQHGLYAALVIEPNGTKWQTLAGKDFGGQDDKGKQIIKRADGGPTSFAANIIGPSDAKGPVFAKREYNIAVADFSLLYSAPPHNRPISPPGRLDHDLPEMVFNSVKPRPEGIAVGDPGGQLLNYRNQPIPTRVGIEDKDGKWSLKSFVAGRPATYAACKSALETGSRLAFSNCPGEGVAAGDADDPVLVEACRARVTALQCDPRDLSNVFSTVTHVGEDETIKRAIVRDNLTYDTRRIFMENYLNPDCKDTADHNCNEPAGLREDGDPSTYLLAAKEGDDVLVRLIQGAQEENHIFFMQGAKWLAVPDSKNSGYRAAQHIGISEHFEFDVQIDSVSPDQEKDFLYGTTATDNLWDGQWGLLRQVGSKVVHAKGASSKATVEKKPVKLASLPTNTLSDNFVPVFQDMCSSAPLRRYKVQAWRLADLMAASTDKSKGALRYHEKRDISDPLAIVYLLAEEVELVRQGIKSPEPLILRANAGDCIEVELSNMMDARPEDLSNPASWSWTMMPPIADGLNFNDVRTSRAIGLYAPLVASNAYLHGGSAVGINPSSLAYPCDRFNRHEFCMATNVPAATGDEPPEDRYILDNRATYFWYAGDWKKAADAHAPTLQPIEFGAIGLQNFGDVIKGASHGTIGALVIEPKDAKWETDCQILDSQTAADNDVQNSDCQNAAATVTPKDGKPFREFVLIYQNDASLRYKGEALANLRNGDDAEDSGQKAFNYRFEPFWTRLDAHPAADPETMMDYDYSNVLSSKPEHGHGDPSTPLFTVQAGTPVRFRIVEPAGHPRNGGFTLSGHDWVRYPWTNDSTEQSDEPDEQNHTGAINAIGPGRNENVLLKYAGGAEHLAGDFLYRTPLGFAFGGGQWGIMRVLNESQCISSDRHTEDAEHIVHTVHADKRTGRLQVCL